MCPFTGRPRVTGLTFNRESRTLTCTSTGGPATTVTWTKDGAVISLNGTYRQTTIALDATRGIYQSILTIAQSVAEHNVYSCMTENSMGNSKRIDRYLGK